MSVTINRFKRVLGGTAATSDKLVSVRDGNADEANKALQAEIDRAQWAHQQRDGSGSICFCALRPVRAFRYATPLIQSGRSSERRESLFGWTSVIQEP